jgi:hypothetical protein
LAWQDILLFLRRKNLRSKKKYLEQSHDTHLKKENFSMSKTQKIHKVVKQWLEHAEEDLRLAKHAFRLSFSSQFQLFANTAGVQEG